MSAIESGHASRPPKGSTKAAIYEAALDAFAEKGYAGASLRDIAHRVGVEPASLYNHIRSKESLLFNLITSTSQDLLDALIEARDAAGDDPRHLLQAVIHKHITYAATHGRHSFVDTVELRALTEAHRDIAVQMRARIEDIYRNLVRACVASDYLPATTNPTVAAYQYIALATNISSWFSPDGPMSPDQVADLTTEFVTNGLYPRSAS